MRSDSPWVCAERIQRPSEETLKAQALRADPLTSYPGHDNVPTFSPDGNFVAYDRCGEEPGANCDIYVKQIGAEPDSRFTSDPAVDFSPAWSPDGLSIAFLRQLSPKELAAEEYLFFTSLPKFLYN
jgi:Tol biopolymer transport system component